MFYIFYTTRVRRTVDPVLGYVVKDVVQVTSGLEVSSVGIKVIMCHRLIDAHAETHAFVGERVDGVHEHGVVRRQSVRWRHALEQGPSGVETFGRNTVQSVCREQVPEVSV